MDKLGALDANFLYTETDSMLNHIASVQRLRLPDGKGQQQFIAEFKGQLLTRLHLIPYMTRKLQEVPGQLDHPFWVRDHHFNIDNHVEEVTLDAPGTFAQFEHKIAELHAEPMDRSKPLWAIKVITGFEDGTIAYYNKVHHACLDGVSGQTAITNMMDSSPEPRVETLPADFLHAEKPLSLGETLFRSFENMVKFQLDATSRALGSIETMTRMAQRAADPSKQFGAFTEAAPRTKFNGNISQARTYAAGECSLADIKAIGRILDCKVNDVFMSLVAGGLRRYLQRNNALPETALIAGCPVSLRQPGDTKLGNQVTMMKVNLATEYADPRIRLLAIRDSANIAKEVTADMAPGFDAEISLPGLPAAIRAATRAFEASKAANVAPVAVNLVISNVPGPRETLYSNGARVLTHYPVSIPAHGAGVNITVQSYVDRLYFAITACADALPDADQLRDDMNMAFAELKELMLPNNISTLKRKQQEQPVAEENQPTDASTQRINRVA
jgi:diacylglycerol O-acyltransferase / wax synthase